MGKTITVYDRIGRLYKESFVRALKRQGYKYNRKRSGSGRSVYTNTKQGYPAHEISWNPRTSLYYRTYKVKELR